MRTVVCALVAALVAMAAPAAALGAQGDGWSGDAGALLGSHDNFFFRGPGAAAPSTTMQTLFANAEWERDTGAGDLTVVLGGLAVLVNDLDDADYQIFDLGLEYKSGPFKYGGTLEFLFNRLFVEEGEPVFFDQNALEVWVRYSIDRRLWVRGKLESARQDFDEAENDRDADVLKLELTARYELRSNLGVRAGLVWDDRDADGARNNREGSGFYVGLEGQPSDKVAFSLRARRREREYRDAPAGDRNFGRDDTVTDLNLNLRWRIGERWGLEVRDEYRDGESTRPDRNFDGNYFGIGVFYEF